MISENDRQLLDQVISNKDKYLVMVDNDIVWVEDKLTGEPIGEFDEYGWQFIVHIFNYIGVEASEV